jgi:hypothetical protein
LAILPGPKPRVLNLVITRSSAPCAPKGTHNIPAKIWEALTRDHPDMIPADTVAITSEDVSERAFADILFHNSYFMHIHLFEPTGVNVWQGGLAHDCKLVQLLSSFGQLTLNVITINIKGITTNIVALTELRAIPSTTTTFIVALDKDFTDLLCLGNSARSIQRGSNTQ